MSTAGAVVVGSVVAGELVGVAVLVAGDEVAGPAVVAGAPLLRELLHAASETRASRAMPAVDVRDFIGAFSWGVRRCRGGRHERAGRTSSRFSSESLGSAAGCSP